MPMLSADDPSFRAMYPHWARVFDAHGRELQHVRACDPETGEVVMADLRRPLWMRIPGLSTFWQRLQWSRSGWLPTRHGFWPAPLRLVANPAPTAEP